jgi:hypothetical protein
MTKPSGSAECAHVLCQMAVRPHGVGMLATEHSPTTRQDVLVECAGGLGLSIAEDAELVRLLAAQVRSRGGSAHPVGRPGQSACESAQDEGIHDAMAAKIRNAVALYRLLVAARVQIWLHPTVLYNSLYRGHDELLINQHTCAPPPRTRRCCTCDVGSRAGLHHLRRELRSDLGTRGSRTAAVAARDRGRRLGPAGVRWKRHGCRSSQRTTARRRRALLGRGSATPSRSTAGRARW